MDKYDFLISSVEYISPLTEDDKQMVFKYFNEQKVRKNEVFIHAGALCQKLFFVASGIIRTYHTNEKGNEFTRVIVTEGQFCTVLASFNEKIPSPASFQALEETMLLEISYQDFKIFVERSEAAKKIYLSILEDYQNYQIQRIEFLTQHSPRERVERFCKEHIHIKNRISSKVISSYLQIVPETYSRFIKKIEENDM